MEREMRVRPGTPDDDNREYLPEKIKNSDIVVNENGNNSQPYPERLKEYREVLADGVEDIWYEYVPEGYDPSKKTPLVVSMHGGLMTGWGQAIYTSWTMVADRDNVIIVFPNAHSRRLWTLEATEEEIKANVNGPEELRMNYAKPDREDNHDIAFVLALIEKINQNIILMKSVFLCRVCQMEVCSQRSLKNIMEIFLQEDPVRVARLLI